MKRYSDLWRFFSSFRVMVDLSNPETLHRISWRCYTVVIILGLGMFTFTPDVTSATAKKVATKAVAPVPEEIIPVERSMESTKGEVVSISATSLSVLYDSDGKNEYEKLISFNGGMKLEGYKKSSDIKTKDIVELGYEKAVESKGTATERSTMTLKTIRFIKRPVENTLAAWEKKE